MDLFKHRDSLRLHFGHKWLTHFGCANGFQDFVTHILDETLSQDVVHIDDLPLFGNIDVVLAFCPHV
jgi:hypothetical protein